MDLNIDLSKLIKIQGTATVLHKPGALKLSAYPLLAHVGGEKGVVLEDVGVPVAEVVAAFVEASGNLKAVAERFGTNENHVADAVRFAADKKYLSEP